MKKIYLLLVSSVFFVFSHGLIASECTDIFPLSTKGRYVIDACGDRFKLKSVNWYGASGEREVVGGLHKQSISDIVSLIKTAGFNSVRLPFSNQMLHTDAPLPPEYLSANPQLIGKTPLEVFDVVVEALAQQDIAIILNNHTSFSEWCCGFDFNGLWYHDGQSKGQWQQDWLDIVSRYQHIPQVVGADLRNEVRTTKWHNTIIPESPNWGWGDQNDWKLVSQETGNLIHSAHQDLLIVVEGINWWGSLPILGSGDRPHLIPIRHDPIYFIQEHKLVYAAHNYGFTGPQHNGSDDTSAGNPKYSDMSREELHHKLDEEFGFVLNANHTYTAPVWVSEFGVGHSDGGSYRDWFINLVDYLIDKDLDFAYWPLNPEKGDGAHDTYALATDDWGAMRNDWRTSHMQRLLNHQGANGEVADTRSDFSILRFENNDNQVADVNDWDSGARKGSCRNGDRAIGLSSDDTLLCSHSAYDNLLISPARFYTRSNQVRSPREGLLNNDDWARGFTKYECDLNHYVAGVSSRWWGTSGVLCARANRILGNQCETLWFDRGDGRQSGAAGDWAPGSYKGQCADDKYIAGIAQRDGSASALLCCKGDNGEVVTLYEHCNRGGYRVSLSEGRYTMGELQSRGLKNDDVSSIAVTSGYKIEMYQHHNFTGKKITKTDSDNCLVDDNFNDEVSSVIVSKR